MVKREFTAIYQKRGKWYIAWIEEIPGVNTQGASKKEAKENLKEALALILKANRVIARQDESKLFYREYREPIRIAVPA